MRKTNYSIIAAGLLVTLLTQPIFAADHLDAPLVMEDGRLDINDSYLFQSPNNANRSVLIMTVNPAAGIFSPMTFNPEGIYEFQFDNNGDAIADVTFSVQFGIPRGKHGGQRFTLRRNNALISRGTTGRPFRVRTPGGGMVQCGLFDDPFFFDLNGFNNSFQFTGEDFFAGLNVSAIVIEIPTSLITEDTTAANVSLNCATILGGNQIDRMGRPAINTVLIPAKLKDAFNAGAPVDDFAMFGDVVESTILSLNGGDLESAQTLTGILLPDVLTANLNDPTGFLNGRQLADDVIDAELSLLTNGALTGDGVDENDVAFRTNFPYLATPHQ